MRNFNLVQFLSNGVLYRVFCLGIKHPRNFFIYWLVLVFFFVRSYENVTKTSLSRFIIRNHGQLRPFLLFFFFWCEN